MSALFLPGVWLDGVQSPIIAVDSNGTLTIWNRHAEKLTGLLSKDVLCQTLPSVFGDGCKDLVQSLSKVSSGDLPADCLLNFLQKSGEPMTLRVKVSAQRNRRGNFVGAMCFLEEATESPVPSRINPADEIQNLATEDTPYQSFLDTTNAVVIDLDSNYRILEWNRRAQQLTGVSSAAALGKSLVASYVSKEQAPSFLSFLSTTRQGKEAGSYCFDWRNQETGATIHLTISASLTSDCLRLVGQDVTGEKRREKDVESAAQELRRLVDTANTPIFGVDNKGLVNEWNEMTAEITGYSKQEALGKHFLDTFIASSWRESVEEVLLDAFDGRGTANYELEFLTKHDEVKYLLVNASTRVSSNGDVVGMLCVAQDVTENAKHDRAVAAMANELRLLIDTANAPIFGIDVDGDVNEWNDKTAEITGFSKEEAFDRPFVETFVVPSLRQSVQEVMDNALQGRGTSNYELEFRTKSNEIRYLLVNATTRRDAENNIVGVVGVAQDVTEAAQHDRAVAAMARELRQLVDTANAPIFGIDVDGNVNEWNDKTAEITGFSGDEAFNRPLVETFIVPKLRPSVQEVMDNALKGRGTSNYELEFVTKSGEIRYLLVNATTRRDAENNIVGVVGVAQDVTEAAKHDRAVAAMANELRQLIDTANAPIFGIDVDGDVNEWNDKTAEITGFTKEEAFDCPLVETFIVPSLRNSVQEVLDNALQGRGTSNYELEFRTKSNEIRHLLVNATTRRDAENNVVGVVGVAQDVTEAVQRDRAVAGMANELRQLIDTANAPIFGIDCDGNINEWNNKTAEITGYMKEEAFDEPLVSKFIVPSLRNSVQEILDHALTGEETSNYELEFVAKSGEIRYLLVNATTRRDPENNVVGGECDHDVCGVLCL